jgi:hypothetical protein
VGVYVTDDERLWLVRGGDLWHYVGPGNFSMCYGHEGIHSASSTGGTCAGLFRNQRGCLGNREPPKDRRFFLICLEKVPAYEQSFIRSCTAPQPSAYFTAPLPSDNSIAAAGQCSIRSHRTTGPIERRACRRCPGERVGRPAQPQDAGPTAQRNREEPWAAGDASGRAHGAENQHDASTFCIRFSPTGRLPSHA